MDLTRTEEQRLLAESAARFISDRHDAGRGRGDGAAPPAFNAETWRHFADLGWLALPIDPDNGGLGGGAVEVGILMEAFGRGLVCEPYLATVVLGAGLIAEHGSEAQKKALLPRVAAGTLRLAFAHSERAARFDLAHVAATARRSDEGWRLDGEKIAVLDAEAADLLIVSARTVAGDGAPGPLALFLVEPGAAGLVPRHHPRLGGGSAAMLTFRDVRLPAEARLGDGESDALAAVEAVVDRALAALSAEAVGMMQAVLDRTLDYTKVRQQFGRPLAANQVVRHRLVDMAVHCDEARSMALRAALKAGSAPAERARAACGAKAKIGIGARFVAEQAVQLHGAMGVTEELDIGAYFKRLLAFETLFGSSNHHHRRHLRLGGGAAGGLDLTAEDKAFEAEVRAFIATHLTPEIRRAQALTPSVFSDPEIVAPWQKALNAKGWVAPGWPKEYGGTGWTPMQRWIFETECARAGVPAISPMGVKMVGPVIIGFGTPEQKSHYLPRMLSGEDYWCQGYSEPGSGSDLASLKTRAVREGDTYVVNGTKIWTTHAHHANRMFALVRTEAGARPQDGISFLLIDMKSPGISIRPILTIGGDHEVNQVFFDDVRVPVANRVGEEGKGWSYGKYLLEFERGSGIASAKLRQALDQMLALARSDATARAIDDPDIARQAARIDIDIDALEMTELRLLSAMQAGEQPGAVSSLIKLRISEIRQAVTRLGVDVIGLDALAVEPMRPLYALNEEPVVAEEMLPVVPEHLNSRAWTIFGGTSEIQRDILAKLMLGL